MFLNYFVPPDAEINTCPHVVLTDSEIECDLHGVEIAANRTYGDIAIQVNAMMAGDKRRQVAVEHDIDLCFSSISGHLVP